MTNELTITNETVAALDKAAENGIIAQREASQFKRTFLVATAIGELQNLLTPKIMAPIMHLQNKSLGFRTDNPNGYPVDVVRDCLIEATMKGVYPVGNEFNIIAGRCYITKEGFFHKLKDIPNFSWIEIPGIPRNVAENGSIIKLSLEWTHNGKKGSKELELAIRVNRGMGADAIIGKAIRKARAWLYTTITGQEMGDGEIDGDVIDTEVKDVPSPFEQEPKQETVADDKGDTLPM